MTDTRTIIKAYEDALRLGHTCVLATVIDVEGSAYRRSGAQLLVRSDGMTAGAISGGCLEGDVIQQAASVFSSGVPKVVKYDTRGDHDLIWGLGSGCNGVIRILIQPLHHNDVQNVIEFAKTCIDANERGVIASVVGSRATRYKLGATLSFTESSFKTSRDAESIESIITKDAEEAFLNDCPSVRSYDRDQVEMFIYPVRPLKRLMIFGAESDTIPLVKLASTLGWHVTVVDLKARIQSRETFQDADEVVLLRTEDISNGIEMANGTSVVIMTHNYFADLELLSELWNRSLKYLGVLGPRARTERLLLQLDERGIKVKDLDRKNIFSPIGLDIGADSPEEVAVSIIAELQAVFASRRAGFLRDWDGPIHTGSSSGTTSILDHPELPATPTVHMEPV